MAVQTQSAMFGLSEQELRDGLVREMATAMRLEGDAPTLHAIAHSVARIIADDHLRMLDQLEQAGVRLEPVEPGASRPTPAA